MCKLFASQMVAMSVCHALFEVFGVNKEIKERYKVDEFSRDLTSLHNLHAHYFPNAMTAFNHILALSTTHKKAREMIMTAFRERLSFYPVFHLYYRCTSRKRDNAMHNLLHTTIGVNGHALNDFRKSRTNVKLARVIRSQHYDSFFKPIPTLNKHSVRYRLEYKRGKKTYSKTLLTVDIPANLFLFEPSEESKRLAQFISKAKNDALQRLINTKYNISRQYNAHLHTLMAKMDA